MTPLAPEEIESIAQAVGLPAEKVREIEAALLKGATPACGGAMSDRDFLCWIHERLEHVHGEKPIVDYMHKLRAVIEATPPDRISANTGEGKNSLDELRASWPTK